MKQKRELKSGMKIRFECMHNVFHDKLANTVGIIDSVDCSILKVTSLSAGTEFTITRRQVVSVFVKKPKKKLREWWVNERYIRLNGCFFQNKTWESWFEAPHGTGIRTTKPEDTTGWIHLVEKSEKTPS